MAATMARSLKLNYYNNTSMAYIYKIQLENNSCSGLLFAKRCFVVVCVEEKCTSSFWP
jgi:hypothetical protein